MKILMIYPKYPDTYWSFSNALKFISKKAAVPPLGLITVASLLPETWEKKLVDMNVSELKSSDIHWADYVFLSAMYVQKDSVNKVIAMCQQQGTKIVAGGPLFTQEFNNYPEIDHFVLNEAEITLQPFVEAIENGDSPQRMYQTDDHPDMRYSPVPQYQLLRQKDYAQMSLQITRGCPYACDFCEITSLLGRKVRMKETQQVIDDLDALYRANWRGAVSVVDDNFIGNKKVVKNSLLPAMIDWMEEHDYPFNFNVQASINLSDDPEMMYLMSKAGFISAFIGIETPSEESLHDCHKVQNENRDMLESVKTIQRSGIQVSAGFIVGFDSDTASIFQRQIDFIQKSGIVSAMVGLLNAPKNTKLHERLNHENRLTTDATGNNTDFSLNFTPKMNYQDLMEGYKRIIQNIYSAKPFYNRLREFLLNYKKQFKTGTPLKFNFLLAFIRSMIVIGVVNQGRGEYWKFFFWTLIRRPQYFTDAITFTVYGYHFRTVYGLEK